MKEESNLRPVETVETAIALLETIKRLDGARLTEVVAEHDLAKSTVRRHLKTLERNGYLVTEGKEYDVALRFLDYGIFARNNSSLYHAARSKVDELAEETGERVWCMSEENGLVTNLCTASGKKSVRTTARVGARTYLHQIAGGKAILARLPEERVETIVDRRGLPAKTERTITDRDELHEELAEIRERGIAYNRQESINGLHAVAAPIVREGSTPIGSISISGPANRMKGTYFEETLPDLLLGTTNEIELNMFSQRT